VAKVKFPIELICLENFTVVGNVEVELTIPRSLSPVLDLVGIGEQERNNIINQRLAEIGQLIGFDPE